MANRYDHSHQVKGSFGTGFGGCFGGCLGMAVAAVLLIGGGIAAVVYFINKGHEAINEHNRSAGSDQRGDARKTPDPKAGDVWNSPEKAVSLGDLQIKIVKASIGKVPLKTITGDSKSADDLLIVRLDLNNTNPTKKIDYHSWSGNDFAFSRDYATLKDNLGNSYKRIDFGLGSHPVGAVERSESIYPKKSITDVLVFEMPVNTATHLDLEMPAKNFGGGEGMIRFRIPIKSVARE